MDDDDIFSFEWMKENLPNNTLVGIAATGEPGNYLPADGGAWIEPIIGIPTRKLAFDTDFLIMSDRLCNDGLTYVYVDGLSNSFGNRSRGLSEQNLRECKQYNNKAVAYLNHATNY